MTFTTLLVKELRSRLRPEYSAWVIFSYLLVIGFVGLGFLLRANVITAGYQVNVLRQIGVQLYAVLALVQLFLIVFIAPALTATTINGEKEAQTFDLLLCSKLSAFSLLAGKLMAGLVYVLLVMAASIPLFSLVYFFGGVSPAQVLSTLVVLVMAAVVVETFSLFCSTLLRWPTISTAIAYAFSASWMFWYWIMYYLNTQGSAGSLSPGNPPASALLRWLIAWNPMAALSSAMGNGQSLDGTPVLFRLHLAPWVAYTLLSLVVSVVLFLVSLFFVRPGQPVRLLNRVREQGQKLRPSTTGKASIS
jgi:ABC-type transport system involved in multi-copper enzyme maturation permease subunit